MTQLLRLFARPIIVVAILGNLALAGCSSPAANPQSTSSQQGPPASHSTPTTTPESSAAGVDGSEHSQDVFSLSVGDCFNGTAVGTVTDVPKVDCAAPHDLEVFYDFQLTGAAYPGDSVVSDAAKAGCQAQFDSFVGMAYADSALDFTEFTPTADSWQGGDRTVSCVIGDPNGKTTGSLSGAAR
jgi:hypothetical protein